MKYIQSFYQCNKTCDISSCKLPGEEGQLTVGKCYKAPGYTLSSKSTIQEKDKQFWWYYTFWNNNTCDGTF